MDGLIIAAGLGSRMHSVAISKPLTLVRGASLLEIAARQLSKAGVQRIIIVTGYQAELVEAALPQIASATGLEIIPTRVDDYTLPNGYSVLAGAALITGNYLLVMADHILDADILCALAKAGAPDRGVTLAVDRRLDNAFVDNLDATYVRTNDCGQIVRISKALAEPDAVDCGAFFATVGLAEAISAAIADGRSGSLSEGIQWLADNKRAATIDVGNAFWIDVDDPTALAMAASHAPEHFTLHAMT